MRTKTIGYIHAFNVQGFLNDKAIIEVELNEGDNEDEAWEYVLSKTKQIADRVQEAFSPKRIDPPHQEERVIQVREVPEKEEKPKRAEDVRWATIVDACFSISELKKWEKKCPKHIYEERFDFLHKLTKQKSAC